MKIFVTGVSSGIGRALLKQLIGDGHQVWGIARKQEELIDLKNELNSENFLFSACDVADSEAVKETTAKMAAQDFLPDVVVLNAAIFPNDIRPKFDQQIFKDAFAVNFFGAVNFIDAFLDKFMGRGSGQFIAIGSTTAFRPSSSGIAYPATKAALAMAMRGFDLAYRPRGVNFSTVYFGPIATKMWEGKKSFLVSTPEKAAIFIAQLIKNKKRESYFPFLSTFIFRLTKSLPDKLFFRLSKFFLK